MKRETMQALATFLLKLMFLIAEPNEESIARFLESQKGKPFSYAGVEVLKVTLRLMNRRNFLKES